MDSPLMDMFDKKLSLEDIENINRLIKCQVELGMKELALRGMSPLRDNLVIEREIDEIFEKYNQSK